MCLPLRPAAVDSVRPAADGKQILLRVILDPRPDITKGDPDRLQQGLLLEKVRVLLGAGRAARLAAGLSAALGAG